MAGETHLLDITFDNVAGSNLQPFYTVDVDTTNSGIHTTAAAATTTSSTDLLGVVYDQAKLAPSGSPVTNSGLTVRVHGVARVIADGAIAAGAYATVSTTTAGYVHTLAPTGSWQNKVAVGRAITTAQASGDQILVILTPGARF